VTDYIVNLQEKIQSNIPLSEAMQFTIVELDSCSILVRAPLQPNVNIHGTGFAGSIYSVAVLAGWALCTHIMELNQMAGDLVVAGAKIKYHSAINGDIECQGEITEVDRDAFCSSYKKLGKSKLELTINVGRLPNAIFQGSYFAVSRP